MHRSSATLADLRKQFAHLLAGLAVLLKLVLRPEAGQRLPAKLRDLLPLGEGFRHRLAMHLGELRLVIERLQMGRPARLV